MKRKTTLAVLAALLFFLAAQERVSGHDISIFDVGTRITIWVSRKKVQLGFLVELKNFPGQDQRKDCDLNKDMKIDDKEREYYIEKCCRKFIDNLHIRINGEEMAKTMTKAEVFGMVGDVDRRPFSTYMEAQIPLDESLYRVRIEYVNDNFRNEEPQIINDVNLSISKELDNLNVYPITPIWQYLDRELPDHLFMEMTLDRQFFIEFGYKDVGSSLEPFAANDIMLTKDSGQTSKQAKAGTVMSAATKTFQQRAYKWLTDFAMKEVERAIKAEGIGHWVWLVLIGIVVGLIHVMLPGHGKGVILGYVAGTHARVQDAIALSLLITLVHTISTSILVAIIILLAGQLLTTTVQNMAVIYVTLLSGLLVLIIGVYMLFFFKPYKWQQEGREEEKSVEETIAKAGSTKSRLPLMWKVALATGIIPCITSSYAATLFIAYQEYLKAFLIIFFIGLGQAITLSGIGAVASGGVTLIRKAAEQRKGGKLMWLTSRLHKPAAVFLVLVGLSGLWTGWQWKKAAGSIAQPMTADERIAAYEKMLVEDAEDFEAHFNLGLLCAAKDELERALVHFRKALQARPEDLDSRRFEAHALTRLEKHEEALKRYEAALKRSPQDENLLFNMAYVEDRLGKHREAIEHYEQVAVRSGDPKAGFNLGLIYEKQSRLDEALKQYLGAVRARPDNAQIHMALANTYRNKKQYEKAAEHLLIVHKKSPFSKEVNLSLANIYLRRLEQPDRAKPFVDAYLKNGGQAEIDAALEELQKQKLTTPTYRKWSPPEAAKKFQRLGACAVRHLEELVAKQTGEQLKSTLAAIAATEAPQALPAIITVLNDTVRWTEEDLYADYGPDLGTPPIPVVAKEAFIRCVRRSAVQVAVEELIRVMGEMDNREYFLKQIYFDSCAEYPVEFMDAVLSYTSCTQEKYLKRCVDLALSLKGEAVAMADDPETLRAFASYVAKWWKENKESLVWDKANYYFHKQEEK